MATYIFDIDGTLADTTHRLWAIKREPGRKPDWDMFFSLMKDDQPIQHMREVIRSLALRNIILYCTGRPETYREVTIDWLTLYNFPVGHELYMRRWGDRRDDDIIKQEHLNQMKADGYTPTMVFEDRSRVVKMWRAQGLPCAQVSGGDF